MNDKRTDDFNERFRKLPQEIKRQARKAFRLYLKEPNNSGLNFKRLQTKEPFYSARVGLQYRVVGLRIGSDMYWDFIGTHAEYEKYLKSL